MLPRDDAELLALAGLDDPPPPEQGLFRAGSWLRRVSSESVVLAGGGRALLLEIAHPLVAEGVAQHSRFREDPLGRLQRTLDALSAIAFRDRAAALAAARGVERVHEGVRGRLEVETGRFAAGTRYDGRDPELMLWVWATLVDTALAITARFVAPLVGEALALYYAEQRVVARLLGIPVARVPADADAFRAYFDAMLVGDALCVGERARAIAAALLDPPRPLPGGSLFRLVTAGMLPPRLREAFGLGWDEAREARLDALARSARALRGERRPALDSPDKGR